MNGPAAPKDPEKKRPYFYIMKDKEIFGAKQEDGSAIHFIYESDGRLINSAQIVGNITDENMLRLLETVEGFGKLVHSIGVSVETDNPKEEMEFIFQMYGKKDLYGGGTNLRCSLTGDGMERRIYLSDYTWTEDDYIPGQARPAYTVVKIRAALMIGPVMYTFRFLKNWLTMQIASKIAVTVICLVFNFINLSS